MSNRGKRQMQEKLFNHMKKWLKSMNNGIKQRNKQLVEQFSLWPVWKNDKTLGYYDNGTVMKNITLQNICDHDIDVCYDMMGDAKEELGACGYGNKYGACKGGRKRRRSRRKSRRGNKSRKSRRKRRKSRKKRKRRTRRRRRR